MRASPPNRMISVSLKHPIHLRARQLVVLEGILKKLRLPLNEWVGEVIEASIAEYKRLEIMAAERLSGPPPIKSGGRSKFTDEDVQNIFDLRADGLKTGAIAERYHVAGVTIRRVLQGNR